MINKYDPVLPKVSMTDGYYTAIYDSMVSQYDKLFQDWQAAARRR